MFPHGRGIGRSHFLDHASDLAGQFLGAVRETHGARINQLIQSTAVVYFAAFAADSRRSNHGKVSWQTALTAAAALLLISGVRRLAGAASAQKAAPELCRLET